VILVLKKHSVFRLDFEEPCKGIGTVTVVTIVVTIVDTFLKSLCGVAFR
jgi:hypothetical protein